ncbi:MAG: tRNA 2-thiouridine(34) synthase MnmA [Lentisphaerae bacterium GWF2_45_14]|nr:MAG: tRNA 2-thiouridine(34) synthase MnmA [Lentisphaerae bacterium GWF2_45_14]
MKVAVGMSGGVDSSVAAWLLKKEGHDVIGITMALWDGDDSIPVRKHACYGPGEKEDVLSAQEFCHRIGIPFHVFDCSKEYKETVLSYFKNEYSAGRTPNPCVKCNHSMKFGLLLSKARQSGLSFDTFATGHYARISRDARQVLRRGKDLKKDQSYFLYRLSQQQLAGTIFPLGNMTKDEVRKIAGENNFPAADIQESQDFYCGDHTELLGIQPRQGVIIDKDGKALGHHSGTWNYTPGQRKGLGISNPVPLYVISTDAEKNTVTAGTKEETLSSSISIADLNWIAIEGLSTPLNLSVKIRSSSKDAAGVLENMPDGKVKITFDSPQSAAAPGQSAVFYNGDIVVGGGVIDKIMKAE